MYLSNKNKAGPRNRSGVSSKTAEVKNQKNGPKLDGVHLMNDSESNSIKQTCKEQFDKSPVVVKSFGHEQTTKKVNIYTEFNSITNQSTDTNVIGSSNNLSSPGLCSALQLANNIQMASIEIKKTKHCSIPLVRNEKHKANVVKKANIPFTKQIFRNLVDLDINDDDIVRDKSVKTKSASFDKKLDSAFILSNFYNPCFSTQCCFEVLKPKVEIEKVQFYDGVDVYNKTEIFNSL